MLAILSALGIVVGIYGIGLFTSCVVVGYFGWQVIASLVMIGAGILGSAYFRFR